MILTIKIALDRNLIVKDNNNPTAIEKLLDTYDSLEPCPETDNCWKSEDFVVQETEEVYGHGEIAETKVQSGIKIATKTTANLKTEGFCQPGGSIYIWECELFEVDNEFFGVRLTNKYRDHIELVKFHTNRDTEWIIIDFDSTLENISFETIKNIMLSG